jgi:host factor-I protein
MDNTTQTLQNVQDAFLNNIRRDRINVTIYLIGGVKLTGRIRSFDKFSVVLESGNLEQLIFKHAITQQHHQPPQPPGPPPAPPAPPGGGGPTPATSS